MSNINRLREIHLLSIGFKWIGLNFLYITHESGCFFGLVRLDFEDKV